MKKNYLSVCSIALTLVLTSAVTSCNKNPNGNKDTANTAISKKDKGSELKMAYVEIDSLMSQYQFCKDYTLLMTKKGESIKATLQARGRALQQAAAAFQQKAQSGGYTQEQAQQQQIKLQKQQIELQNLQEKLSNQYEQEQQKYNNEMRDSIRSFLNEYNKTHNYSFIISKAGDNLLYAEKSLDITSDVVNGLNKRYKPNENVLGKTK